jgi:hypothetical protein
VPTLGSIGVRRAYNAHAFQTRRLRAGDRLPNLRTLPFAAPKAPAAAGANASAFGGRTPLLAPHSLDQGRQGAGRAILENPGPSIYPFHAHGWTVLLCEGRTQANQSLAQLTPGFEPADAAQLRARGEELVARSRGLVSSVGVLPSGHPDEALLGVFGQVLFLVRPDAYIGLRAEPANIESVLAYARDVLGVAKMPDRSKIPPLATAKEITLWGSSMWSTSVSNRILITQTS